MKRKEGDQKRMDKEQNEVQAGQEAEQRRVLELVVDPGERVGENPPGEVDELADRFFDDTPASFPPQEIWGDELGRAPQRSRGSRFAQYTTFAMMGVFLVGIGSYTYYARVVMPTPVEVGAAGGLLQSPFPEATRPGPRSPAAAEMQRAAGKQQTDGDSTALETVEVSEVAAAGSTQEPTGDAASTGQAVAVAAVAPVPVVEEAAPARPAPAAAAQAPSTLEPAASPVAATGGAAAAPKERAAEPRPTRAVAARSKPARRAVASRKGSSRGRGARAGSEPNQADVLRKMAYHYLNQGRHRDAERYASQAVGVDPKSSQGWILLGLARDALQDREGAKSAFQRCIQAEGPYVSECRRLKGGYM
jgi:hypothetical protein